MRRAGFRILALLTLLVVVSVATPPLEGTVFCFIVDQQCVPCGPDLSKECTYRECTDGTSRTSCTQCSLFCSVS
jgi:hypothetical protein